MFGATPGSGLVRGYVDAVERFRERAAIGVDSPREVYPPLFEALNWAHSLWDTWFRLVEPQDRHLDAFATCTTVATTSWHLPSTPMPPQPAAGVGMPSVIFHPRILVAATTLRARRITPSCSHKGRFRRRWRLSRDTCARSSPSTSCNRTCGTAPHR